MKLGITADLHLTSQKEHPQRFEVLRDILRQSGETGVDRLVIAGDLFDQSPHNVSDFEAALKKARPKGLPVTVIPGNHDVNLRSEALAVDGVQVVNEPVLWRGGNGDAVLLVPYAPGTTLGEHLAAFEGQLAPRRWTLISHADWMGGLRTPDPDEPGIYMPLNRSDLQLYQPATVLLGHVHVPWDHPPIHYPGSPCPLDVTETGLRRFLVHDTESQQVTHRRVNSPLVYFNETVVVLPVDDEQEYLEHELTSRIDAWGLPDGWEDRVQVRLRLVGYSADRAAAEKTARACLEGFSFYEGSPDLADLNLADDPDRIEIARQAKDWIDELTWPDDPREPEKAEILREALGVIYGA
jgi:exonuclease SbcD